MNCEYVRQHYHVPACIGRRVMVYGKPGIIAEDRGHYIGVNLDTDKPSAVNNYHPTDEVEYLGMGKVLITWKTYRRARVVMISIFQTRRKCVLCIMSSI